jgi:hypothetical protein
MPAFSLLSYEWGPVSSKHHDAADVDPTRDDLEQVLDISIHLKEEKQMGPAGNPEEEFTPLAPSGRPGGLQLEMVRPGLSLTHMIEGGGHSGSEVLLNPLRHPPLKYVTSLTFKTIWTQSSARLGGGGEL